MNLKERNLLIKVLKKKTKKKKLLQPNISITCYNTSAMKKAHLLGLFLSVFELDFFNFNKFQVRKVFMLI